MGKFITLGQGIGATLVYEPATKIVRWSAPGYTDVQVYVNGELFGGGESGTQSAPWVQQGQSYEFKLIARKSPGEFSEYLATVIVGADGTVAGQTIVGGEIPPAAGGGGGSGTAAAPSAGSWFDQSTMLLGTTIPNLYLAAGGGLLFLAAVAAKKKR